MFFFVYAAAVPIVAAFPGTRRILLPALHFLRLRRSRSLALHQSERSPSPQPAISLPASLSPRELLTVGAALESLSSENPNEDARRRLAQFLGVKPQVLTPCAAAALLQSTLAGANSVEDDALPLGMAAVRIVSAGIWCHAMAGRNFSSTLSQVRGLLVSAVRKIRSFLPSWIGWGFAYYCALNFTAYAPMVLNDEDGEKDGGVDSMDVHGAGTNLAIITSVIGTLSAFVLLFLEVEAYEVQDNDSDEPLHCEPWEALVLGIMALPVGIPAVWSQSNMLGLFSSGLVFAGFCCLDSCFFVQGSRDFRVRHGSCCAVWFTKVGVRQLAALHKYGTFEKQMGVFDFGFTLFGPIALNLVTLCRAEGSMNYGTFCLLTIEAILGTITRRDELLRIASVFSACYTVRRLIVAYKKDQINGMFICSSLVVFGANALRDDFVAEKLSKILRK